MEEYTNINMTHKNNIKAESPMLFIQDNIISKRALNSARPRSV